MFKYGSRVVREGHSWIDDNGINQSPQWNLWSPEDKKAAGLLEFIPQSPPDDRLYIWTQNPDGTINSTDKPLADSGSGDNVVRGVRFELKQAVKHQQGALLSQTDWMVIRKADNSTAIPANVQTWRDAIRTKATAMEAAIDSAADTAAMATLLDSDDLGDWPELES